MKTWESLRKGDIVMSFHGTKTEVAEVLGDIVFLHSNRSEALEAVLKETLKEYEYTIVQDIPETVEVNGKKYLKSAVIERLEELDPIE